MNGNKKTKLYIWPILAICICILILVGVFFSLQHIDLNSILTEREYHRTTDLAAYGNYTGTAKDDYVQAFINSYFPEKIEECFDDITFAYCAEGADTYGFEAYLEFTINDQEEFDEYIQNIGQIGAWQEFSFDPSFQECELRDGFRLTSEEAEGNDRDYNIECASIKKILYDVEEQRIIYWGLGVYDGGFADTGHFNIFFDRFELNPYLYAQQAYFPASELIEP